MPTAFFSKSVAILLGALLTTSAYAQETGSEAAANPEAIFWLIGFVMLALGVSFLCSVAETVLLSITPAYIENLRSTAPKLAERLQVLRQDKVDRSLAAILTMNTIAHTVGAIEAGAQSAVVFGSSWVGFFSAVMTLLILFFSEIIPKTLGAVFWPKLVRPTVGYIRFLIVAMYPLVQTSEAITRFITRKQEVPKFKREEFIAMAGLGQKAGEIDSHELRIIHNLFHFRSLTALDIMTPRSVIATMDETLTIAQAIEVTSKLPFSRFPIYKKDIDQITGFVLKNELLQNNSESKQSSLIRYLRRDIDCVPECMNLPQLLEFLLDKRQHIALVVDEYGSTRGLVTLEDAIETLLGMEIIDEADDIADMQQWARSRWRERSRKLGIEPPKAMPPQNSDQSH